MKGLGGSKLGLAHALTACMPQVDHLQGRLFVDRMEATTFIASSVLRGAPAAGLPMPLATGPCTCTHVL